MTPEKQRIAIAEACGWTHIFHVPFLGGVPPGSPHPDSINLPDYLNDLNAMYQAEKALTGRQSEDYWDELASMVPRNQGMFGVLHTSARFRAAAFLRTIGKWDETP